MIENNSIAKYLLLQKEFKAKAAEIKKIINALSYLRLGVFGLAILFTYLFFDEGFKALAIIVFIMLVSFLIIVKKQVKQQKHFDFTTTRLKLVENELGIFNGNVNIYDNGSRYVNQEHLYTDDLDIFGAYSIFGYLNRCVSDQGLLMLSAWLMKPSDKLVIENRQEAAEELSKYETETLNFRAQLFNLDAAKISSIEYFFSTFLPKKLDFLTAKYMIVFIDGISALNILLLTVAVIYGSFFWSILGISLLISAVGYFFFKKRIDLIHENIGASVGILDNYADNIAWITTTEWKSALLINEVKKIKSESILHLEIKQLSKIVDALNNRLNPIVGLVLNLFFQWDLRCLRKLAKWEQQNNELIVKGLNVVSEFEVLITLAVHSNNHPTWINPKINEQYSFKATGLGHPLIKLEDRVVNEFSLAQDITVDVITGSNMAGKSTFLRTLGVNMVLAFAGAKVCASTFESSVFNILSYMRIKDSLSNQTSTFKAEIDRLKMILEHTQIDKHSFVLIDEMLRGTNSRDKYLGSKVFIKKLIAQKTPGLIATHDLQIAELENEFPKQLRNFHFDIQIKEEEMYFDYLIKKGECKTFNASILLKNIGLQIEE